MMVVAGWDSSHVGYAFNLYTCLDCGRVARENVWKNPGVVWIEVATPPSKTYSFTRHALHLDPAAIRWAVAGVVDLRNSAAKHRRVAAIAPDGKAGRWNAVAAHLLDVAATAMEAEARELLRLCEASATEPEQP